MNEVLSGMRAGNGQSWAASSSTDLIPLNFLCQLKPEKAGRLWSTAERGGENLKHDRASGRKEASIRGEGTHNTAGTREESSSTEKGKFKVRQYDLSLQAGISRGL